MNCLSFISDILVNHSISCDSTNQNFKFKNKKSKKPQNPSYKLTRITAGGTKPTSATPKRTISVDRAPVPIPKGID